MAKKCMKCGGSTTPKMAKGGSTTNKLNNARGFAKPQVGGSNVSKKIYGVPNAGPTGPNLQGIDTMKKGGTVAKAKFGAATPVKASCKKGQVRSASGACVSERPKFAKGGSSFGMLSVKAGVDKNPKPTAADRIAGAKMKKGGTMKKYQNGGATKSTAPAKPKPKYVYGDVPGIGGPAAGQAATPGETILMDQKLAAERKAKAAAAKRKAQATKKGK